MGVRGERTYFRLDPEAAGFAPDLEEDFFIVPWAIVNASDDGELLGDEMS